MATDRRQYRLALTAKGRQTFAKLERSSQDEVGAMLAGLDDNQRAAVVQAMTTIEQTLEPPREKRAGFLLRSRIMVA